jgi:hypothetical protein
MLAGSLLRHLRRTTTDSSDASAIAGLEYDARIPNEARTPIASHAMTQKTNKVKIKLTRFTQAAHGSGLECERIWDSQPGRHFDTAVNRAPLSVANPYIS